MVRPTAEVRVAEARTGRVLWRAAVAPGSTAVLRYRHSVERTPVVERFRVESGGLRFVEMRFVSQGAGLPTEGYVREGGEFVLRGDRWVGALPVVVTGVAGHVLSVDGEDVDLVRLGGDGAALILEAGRGVRFRWLSDLLY